MTMKYREAFRSALGGCRLQAVQRTDVADALLYRGEGHMKYLEDYTHRAICDSIRRAVMERAELTTELHEDFILEARVSVNVFTDDELDRLIQAAVERARADHNWRSNRAPSFPSAC